ncbi:restriction endonuclease subunit S, partial [Campylobacter helveticus]
NGGGGGGGGKIPTYTTSSIIISEEERDFIQGAIMEIAQNLLKDLNCEWGEFKIGKLFSVKSNPQLNKNSFEFVENGEYPYFTRTVYNNGILGYVKYLDEEHKIKGNSIAVGLIAMHFFYMQKDFYAGQFTKTIYPKFKGFNKNIALFFTALFNANKKQYLKNFIVKDFEKDFLNTNILLPIDSKGNPNFALMESFIKNIETKHTGKLIAYYKYLKLANHNSCAFKASL